MTDRREDIVGIERTVGRLEGQFSGLGARVANLESVSERRANLLADGIKDLRAEISDLKEKLDSIDVKDANRAGLFKGGWTVAVFFGSLLLGAAGFLLQAAQFFAGK